ncbi:MAG: VOC family protein [Flavobacteriaceae bacterium]
MVFEHFALNVDRIGDRINWYVDHIELEVMSRQTSSPYMTFLADSSGRVILELYHRSDELMTDFKRQHPLTFHLAFVSEDAEKDKERLLNAGASFEEEVNKEDGSKLVMLRDPWGMPLQLCQRTRKF